MKLHVRHCRRGLKVTMKTYSPDETHGKSDEKEGTGPADEDNVQKEEVVTNAKGPRKKRSPSD